MLKIKETYHYFHCKFLSERTKKKGESIIINVAIASFVLHLLCIALVNLKILPWDNHNDAFSNPIAAIYTPFSFILIYEVYLLVYYLQRSVSIYIAKQYEIITLIVIRKIYKDLSKLEFTSDWFNTKNDLQFTYDILATIILFFLIYMFYKLNKKRGTEAEILSPEVIRFIKMKRIIATCLVPVLIVLALYSLVEWLYQNFFSVSQMVKSITDVNKIFFDDFFTILVLTDVLLLLISFFHTDKFNGVIRNSGFIISTILIKLSFGAEGLLNTILTVSAVLIGVLILGIHNKHEKLDPSQNT